MTQTVHISFPYLPATVCSSGAEKQDGHPSRGFTGISFVFLWKIKPYMYIVDGALEEQDGLTWAQRLVTLRLRWTNLLNLQGTIQVGIAISRESL